MQTASGLATETLLSFGVRLGPTACELVQLAAPREGVAALDLHISLNKLIRAWRHDRFFTSSDSMDMRRIARTSYAAWLRWLGKDHPVKHRQLLRQNKIPIALLDMPSYHGERNDQWNHLPATAMLPLIDDRQPIAAKQMQPLSMDRDDIDPEVLGMVAAHISKANRIYAMPKASQYDSSDSEVELNGLGLRVHRHPVTGKRHLTETYYGCTPEYIKHARGRKFRKPDTSREDAQRPAQSVQPSVPRSQPSPSNAPPHSRDAHQPFIAPPPQIFGVLSPPHIGAAISPPTPLPPPPPPSAFQVPFVPPPPRPQGWDGPWPPPPPIPGFGPGLVPPPPPPPSSAPPPPPRQPGNGASWDRRDGRGYAQRDGHGYGQGRNQDEDRGGRQEYQRSGQAPRYERQDQHRGAGNRWR